MNKIQYSILLTLLMCSTQVLALSKELSVTVGVKGWYTGLTVEDDYTDVGDQGKFTAPSNDSSGFGLMVGPTLAVKFRRFQFGLNYSKGSFEFPGQWDGLDTTGSYITDSDLEMTRTDTDIYVGFQVNPHFSVVLGQKTLKSEVSYKNTVNRYSDGTTQFFNDSSNSYTYSGPFLGITGFTSPNSRGLLMFGSLALSKLKVKEKGDDTMDGTHFEVGLAYIPKASHLFYTLSLRGQGYDYSDNSTTTGIEAYGGVNGGVNYRF